MEIEYTGLVNNREMNTWYFIFKVKDDEFGYPATITMNIPYVILDVLYGASDEDAANHYIEEHNWEIFIS